VRVSRVMLWYLSWYYTYVLIIIWHMRLKYVRLWFYTCLKQRFVLILFSFEFWLTLLLCLLVFCLKSAMIMCYTWVEDLAGDVTPQWVDREALFYFIFWFYEYIPIKSSMEIYILKKYYECMNICTYVCYWIFVWYSYYYMKNMGCYKIV